MSGKSERSVTLEDVQTRLEQWRQNRKGRAVIPDELWSAAIEVACSHGVNRTAAALHLDGGKLKRRMVAAGAALNKTAAAKFVELIAPVAGAVPECNVELEGRHGKLRIELKGTTTAEVAALSRMLWELGS